MSGKPGLDLVGVHDGFLDFIQHVDGLLHLLSITDSDGRRVVDHHHGHRAHADLGTGHSDDGCRRSSKSVDLDRYVMRVIHQHVVNLRSSKNITARTVDPEGDVSVSAA